MPQIVFIPGLLLTPEFFSHQADSLSPGHDISYGKTTGMDTITAMAEGVLDETKGSFTPVGLSMGGYVALELARLAPDRLDAMVVMDSNAVPDSDEKIKDRKALIEMSRLGKFKGVTRTLLPRLIAPHHLEDEQLCQKIMDMAGAIGQENFALQQMAIMTRRDQFDTLEAFSKPSLFIAGDCDALTPPEQVRAMADAVKGSRFVEIANTGHLPPLESPEETTASLKDFLKEIY
jgi:pimeloyl-ACP methyl ester carboxylesterase